LADVRYYTVSDQLFFVGTVALFNSLRLTGNSGELVVLDCGLTPEQRRLLDPHATVVSVPDDIAAHPAFAKPFVSHLRPAGVAVFLDSDIIVTQSLDRIVSYADAGKICLYPGSPGEEDRWFSEWYEALALRAPLRRQAYMSAGLLAFSTEHWPNILQRWSDVCDLVPRDQYFTRAKGTHPFWVGEMDALNALLMSEVPAEAIHQLPEEEAVLTGGLRRVRVLDSKTLRCSDRDRQITCLHYSGRRKPWMARSWRWARRDAFVRLLPRVLFGDDVILLLPEKDAPRWLRNNTGGYLLRYTLFAVHSPRGVLRAAARGIVHRLPRPLRQRLLTMAGRMAHGRQ
jgi:hypothetical protein